MTAEDIAVDSCQVRGYLDGVEVATGTVTPDIAMSGFEVTATGPYNLYIGAYNNYSSPGVSSYFAGGIDEFRILNKILSLREVRGLYDNNRGTEEDAIIASNMIMS